MPSLHPPQQYISKYNITLCVVVQNVSTLKDCAAKYVKRFYLRGRGSRTNNA